MSIVKVNVDKIFDIVGKDEFLSLKSQAESANKMLEDKTGKGNDFLGWVNLPSEISVEDIYNINKTATELANMAEVVVVIGIGGSYLGSKAVMEAIHNSFDSLRLRRKSPLVLFAGQNISEDYMVELLKVLEERSFATIVISKSGTTTEPAIAFRIIKQEIERRYGKEEASKRIVAITDSSRGALRDLSTKEGYQTYVIPDDVGGRFSVLTPVGLLPLAVAGINIEELVKGAVDMAKLVGANVPFEHNPALQYAAARSALYGKGKTVELLAAYEPKFQYFAEWWKQLYGESEGKDGKGIFPASVIFTTDLHSMGQYIQDGLRILFETVISVKNARRRLEIPMDEDNLDQLNFLAGRRISEVNRMAEQGTMLAHVDGGVPNINIEIDEISEYTLGAMIYFFERACGVCCYMLGVNPFDQPGVEAYKKNMFALLGKKGYEEEGEKLRKRL